MVAYDGLITVQTKRAMQGTSGRRQDPVMLVLLLFCAMMLYCYANVRCCSLLLTLLRDSIY